MAEVEEGTGGKEFSVETPLGKFNSKGYHLGNLLQIVAASLLAIVALMMYEMRIEIKESTILLRATVSSSAVEKVDHDKITRAIDKQTESQEATSYILTLTQADREKLRLAMPESLRRRGER